LRIRGTFGVPVSIAVEFTHPGGAYLWAVNLTVTSKDPWILPSIPRYLLAFLLNHDAVAARFG
jgi:hypothetical protein